MVACRQFLPSLLVLRISYTEKHMCLEPRIFSVFRCTHFGGQVTSNVADQRTSRWISQECFQSKFNRSEGPACCKSRGFRVGWWSPWNFARRTWRNIEGSYEMSESDRGKVKSGRKLKDYPQVPTTPPPSDKKDRALTQIEDELEREKKYLWVPSKSVKIGGINRDVYY